MRYSESELCIKLEVSLQWRSYSLERSKTA